jgi:Anti-sigma-K factor rskA/Putative zinc-finger
MMDRESMPGTPDCSGDAAAYMLGALEPEEAEVFRSHLHECAVCRDEVESFDGVIQALPLAAHQYKPPRGLKRRLLQEVQREQAVAGREGARRRRAWRGPRQLLAGGVATLVAAGGLVTAIELSAGVAATVVTAQVSGIAGTAQLRVTSGHAELVVRHLTPPGRGHVYEVWLKSGKAAPVPASVLFGVNSSGDADVGIPKSIHGGVSAVMVTKEPLDGSPAPTTSPVIVARID